MAAGPGGPGAAGSWGRPHPAAILMGRAQEGERAAELDTSSCFHISQRRPASGWGGSVCLSSPGLGVPHPYPAQGPGSGPPPGVLGSLGHSLPAGPRGALVSPQEVQGAPSRLASRDRGRPSTSLGEGRKGGSRGARPCIQEGGRPHPTGKSHRHSGGCRVLSASGPREAGSEGPDGRGLGPARGRWLPAVVAIPHARPGRGFWALWAPRDRAAG